MKRLKKTSGKEIETRTYEISSHYPHMLDKLEEAFRMVEYLCNIGASREVSLYVDGDGRTDFEFERVDTKKDLAEMENMEQEKQKEKITFGFD